MKRVENISVNSKRVLVIVSIALISTSGLFAQKSVSKWRLFETNKAEAEVVYSAPSSVAVVSYDNYLKTLDFIIEDKVELEDWMTDASEWESNVQTDEFFEEELALEEWMLNFSLLNDLQDSDLALEEWMNSTENWR